ncbi:MAG: hypothetical protein II713_03310, partial [Clostridia bacterium]|nr:hypothetical protein [Clostridia bacterium]
AMQFHRKPEADFKETVRNFREFIGTAFPDADNSSYITLGGYNLNRILTHMDRLHDPYCRFNFTTIEALMSGGGAELPVPEHKNKYRRMMLEREFGGRFWDVLAEVKPKYIFMDLIEERFDLLETESGILTMSDAFEGSSLSGMPRRVIPRLSDECGELFKKCAETFVSRVKKSAPEARFVIIKNLLAESVGGMESREPFADTAAIRNVNAVLKEYYEYLEGIIPDGLFIDPTADELYFTDRNYEYGAVPSHLNEIENRRIAAKLEEMLK